MKVEYKPVSDAVKFWHFDRPADVSFCDGQLEEVDTIVDAIGSVKDSVLVVFKHDSKVTVARKALNAMMRKYGFSDPFGVPIPLDKAHLHSWGFYWTEAKVEEVSEAILDAFDSDSPETVVAYLQAEVDDRTVEKDRAQKQADERRAAGQLEEAKELEEEAQRHAHRLEVLSIQLRLLTPGQLMLSAPVDSEPSSGSTELCVSAGGRTLDDRMAAVDDRLADVEDRKEKVKELVEEHAKKSLINWVYGSCDTLVCYEKPKMSIQQRLLYIRSKNPNPSPVEFATLFMEASDRCLEPGKNAMMACKEAHKKHDPNFSFNSLPESVRKEYQRICYRRSGCAVCGRSMFNDEIHCSKKCADNACECCNGPLQRKVSERPVWDCERSTKINELEGILKVKDVCEPLVFSEQLKKYHKACQGKISCPPACKECQPTHDQWLQQQCDWKKRADYAREPESFWEAKQQQLESLRKTPELTTQVVNLRVCAGGCSGEQRSDKRSRNAEQRHREMVEGLDVGAKRRRL